jgi:MoxR-like ATPase
MTLQLVPELDPGDLHKAEAIAHRLRAYEFTLKIWRDKLAHAQAMIDEYTRAREAFIAHLPVPVWLSERGEIGTDCPDDAA